MFRILVDFAGLFLASMLVGAMFAVWLIFNAKGLDGQHYVALHQQSVRTLDPAMPALGAATIVATLVAAAMARHDNARLALRAGAAAGFLAAGLITRFLNQPINAAMMTWSSAAPPADWTRLRDAWWRWHVARLACGIGALSALILADLTGGVGG